MPSSSAPGAGRVTGRAVRSPVEGSVPDGDRAGEPPSDAQLFGVGGSADREAMVREAVEHILSLWSTPAPHHRPGTHWSVSVDASSAPEFRRRRVHQAVPAAASALFATSIMSPGSRSARMAGELGWIPISSAAFLHACYTVSHWEQYLAGAEVAGRSAIWEIWRVVRQVVVAPSDADARDHVLAPDGPLSFWYRYVLGAMRARKALPLVAPAHHPDPESLHLGGDGARADDLRFAVDGPRRA